jgi:hypothetical protein
MYQGTSLWLWVVQGFIWCCVAALVVAVGLALLAGAALVGLGWLAWRGWLALRGRRGPPEPHSSETRPVEGSGSESERGRNFA